MRTGPKVRARARDITITPNQARDRLQNAFAVVDPNAPTAEWTHAALSALAGLGEEHGLRVDPPGWSSRGRDEGKAGEFLWDLVISRWPHSGSSSYEYPAYFRSAARGQHAVLELVAESEWGKSRSPHANGLAVMEDFSKLLAARVRVKVMIFAYHSSSRGVGTFEELSGLMAALTRAAEDPTAYLLYGLDWRSTESKSAVIANARLGVVETGRYGHRAPSP
jgi:hypothetical protein